MSKELFEYTKLNLERTVQGLLTKKSEFIYTDTESAVPIDKTYSIYYLMDKRELYFRRSSKLSNKKQRRQLYSYLREFNQPSFKGSNCQNQLYRKASKRS